MIRFINTSHPHGLIRAGLFSAVILSTQLVAGTLTFNPTKDAAVKQNFPTTNYGTDTAFVASGLTNFLRHSFIQFTVSGIPSGSTVTAAHLLLDAETTATGQPVSAHTCSTTSWGETAITWNTQPTYTGTALSTVSNFTSGTDASWDVSGLVTGNGTYCIAMDSTFSNYTQFASREAGGASMPELVVTYSSPMALLVGAAYPAGSIGYPSSIPTSSSAHYTWATGIIGNLQAIKCFYSGALPASFSGSEGDGFPASVTPIICYRTENTNVLAFCQSVTKPIILIYHQEPEGDYTNGSTFVSEFETQSNLIRSANNPNIRVAMCAAGYPYRNGGTTDVLSGNYLKGLGSYVDLFVKDVYQDDGSDPNQWTTNGLANLPLFQNWLALAVGDASLAMNSTTANAITNAGGNIVGTKKPLGVTEYGIGQSGSNSDRLARIQLDASYLSGAFLTHTSSPLQCWLYWWDDNGMMSSTDVVHEYQFQDSATEAQWKAYCPH